MQIIPGINCLDFECVKSRFTQAREMLSTKPEFSRWVHIDIADGGFTGGYETWRNPEDLQKIEAEDIKIELHCMMNEPEAVIASWLSAGIARLIFHLEATSNVEVIAKMCREKNIQSMLAIGPETPAEHLLPYLSVVDGAQILAVSPGKSGQLFTEDALTKIQTIRKAFPEIIIEVDGGITKEVAQKCISAGASQLAITSAIFNTSNPAEAFQDISQAV